MYALGGSCWCYLLFNCPHKLEKSQKPNRWQKTKKTHNMEETTKQHPAQRPKTNLHVFNKNHSPFNESQHPSQLVLSGSYEQLLDRGAANQTCSQAVMCHWFNTWRIGWTASLLVFQQKFDPHERLTRSKDHNWSHPNNQPSTPQKPRNLVAFGTAPGVAVGQKIQSYIIPPRQM